MTIIATLVLALAVAERLSSIVIDKDEVANAVGLRDEEHLEMAVDSAHLQGTTTTTATTASPTWMRPSAINPAATCSTSNADVERPSGPDASQTTCWRTFDGSDNTVFHTSGGAHNPELGVNSRRTHGSSGWTNRPDLGPPTLTYDFGGNVQISGFRQYAYRASFAAAECLRDFTLYTCTDSACTTRTSIGSFSHAGTSQTFAEDQTSTFTSVSTRYLMVELTGNHGDTAWGGRVNIAEVEFLSQVPGSSSSGSSSAVTFTNHGFGVCCSGRNEIDGSGASTREECEALCAADATCISYEYHNPSHPCQMSTSCTYEIAATQNHPTCSLYTKDEGTTTTTTTTASSGSSAPMQNHLDITTATRDSCVAGKVAGREALTGGASCYSETNVTCATKYEQKTRSTHRVGQQDPHAAHGTAAPTESYSEAYDLVGELHLCEWRPQLHRCEAGKVLTVCPEEDHVVEVATGATAGTTYTQVQGTGTNGQGACRYSDGRTQASQMTTHTGDAAAARAACDADASCLSYEVRNNGKYEIHNEAATHASEHSNFYCYNKDASGR